MTQRRSFLRKIIYIGVVVLLLLPLAWLSQPATTDVDGGKLAQLRRQYQISQASLGEIDPASETMKLATLGMRGIAANLLWETANEYKKKEDWTGLTAALEQIAKLQPHFIAVWRHQAWNLSYNVSVEFDDYHDRYYWVMRGIEYLKEGTKYNANEPRLLWDIGWFISQKIGRADEHEQFRRLFKADDDFHGPRPLARRDNWLVGREWFLEAQNKVDKHGIPIRGMMPVVFHRNPAMSLMNYSEALEEDGVFGEVAKASWQRAGSEWRDFGSRDFVTLDNDTVRLNDAEAVRERSREALAQLNAMVPPDERAALEKEKRAKLTAEELELFDIPEKQLTTEQQQQLYVLRPRVTPTYLELAARVPAEKRAAALRAAETAQQADRQLRSIETYRDVVAFNAWKLRAESEATDDALAARQLTYDARQALNATDLDRSRKLYEQSFEHWRKVIDKYPDLLSVESHLVDDLNDTISKYRKVLEQMEEPFPKDFVLADVVKLDAMYGNEAAIRRAAEQNPLDPQPPPKEEK